MTSANGSELIEIRKYPNRRYYDTTRSRHLTLEDIRQLIRKGSDVRIVDSQSGADITSKTLTQMILEFDSPKLELFTVPLLTELIRVNDQVIKGFFEKFFDQALASFLTFQQQLERQLRTGTVLPSIFPPFNAWPFQAPAPREAASEAPPRSSSSPSDRDLSRTVQQLQEQVAGLQEKLSRSPRRPKRSRKKR